MARSLHGLDLHLNPRGPHRELSLELAHLLRAGPDRGWRLSRHAAGWAVGHDQGLPSRLGHRAHHRLLRRSAADLAVENRVLDRFSLRRILSQHAAPGAALSLVLRVAGAAAELRRAVAEADAERAV